MMPYALTRMAPMLCWVLVLIVLAVSSASGQQRPCCVVEQFGFGERLVTIEGMEERPAMCRAPEWKCRPSDEKSDDISQYQRGYRCYSLYGEQRLVPLRESDLWETDRDRRRQLYSAVKYFCDDGHFEANILRPGQNY